MKTFFMIAALLIPALAFSMGNNKEEKAEFKVYGACGMCKERIEKAALVEGIASAQWSQQNQILSLVYDPSRVKLPAVHQKIADAGHDTEEISAKDKVYEALPACCKYQRKQKASEGSAGRSCCSH